MSGNFREMLDTVIRINFRCTVPEIQLFTPELSHNTVVAILDRPYRSKLGKAAVSQVRCNV